MTNACRFCTIRPEGYSPPLCLMEATEILQSGLNSSGCDCDIAINGLTLDRTHIILGSQKRSCLSMQAGLVGNHAGQRLRRERR